MMLSRRAIDSDAAYDKNMGAVDTQKAAAEKKAQVM